MRSSPSFRISLPSLLCSNIVSRCRVEHKSPHKLRLLALADLRSAPTTWICGHLCASCIWLSSPWHNSGLIWNSRSNAYLHLTLWASLLKGGTWLAQLKRWVDFSWARSLLMSHSALAGVWGHMLWTRAHRRTHSSTEITNGVWATLYNRPVMRLTPSKAFRIFGFELMWMKLFQENPSGYFSGMLNSP